MKMTLRNTTPTRPVRSPSDAKRGKLMASSTLSTVVQRVAPGLRVTAYVAGLAWLACALSIREARGALGEASLSLGRQLSEVADSLVDAKEVELNGQRLLIATSKVSEPVHAVLERFEAACRAHAGELAPLARRHGIAGLAPAAPGAWSYPVVRTESEREGVLGCLVAVGGGVGGLKHKFERFLESRDAAVFGTFLVVYLKAQQHGTQLVVAWNPESLKVLDLFPEAGDAPGSDSLLLGRLAGTRRILSGVAPGQPYGLRVYESTEPSQGLLERLTAELATRGWSSLETPAPPGARAFLHESGVLALASATSASGKTFLSLCEMGTGAPTADKLGRLP